MTSFSETTFGDAVRKRTSMLFLGGFASLILGTTVLAGIWIAVFFGTFYAARYHRALWHDDINYGTRALVATIILAAFVLVQLLREVQSRPLADKLGYGEATLEYEPNSDGCWQFVFFGPYVFFLGWKLWLRGTLLLLTPAVEIRMAFESLQRAPFREEELPELCRMSSFRAAAILLGLDAIRKSGSDQLALTSNWKELLEDGQ